MIAGYNREQVGINVSVGSVVAGTVVQPIMIAPFGGMTVVNAYIAADEAVVANGSNYFTAVLRNAGAAGTATTAIGTAGGTAGVTVAPAAFSLNTAADELTVGQYLSVAGLMTGALADNQYRVIVEWVRGKG